VEDTVERWPDFFLAGAPKAGTTALHAALVGVPGIALSQPKEPKYFLCGDRPPRRSEHRGPGDAHSRQEWIWRRERYLRLWDGAPSSALRGESTPFYLYDTAAHRRIAEVNPATRFVALLRDPVDRAYSNWMHLWSDGLEPEADFLAAVEAEEARRQAGWAPFWRYRGLGRYGEQLASLRRYFPADQTLTIRYGQLVAEPESTVRLVLDFLGVDAEATPAIPRDNSRAFRPDSTRNRALAHAARAGAALGAYAPPKVWRAASVPLLKQLHRADVDRPELTAHQRSQVMAPLLPDIELLEQVTGDSFADWRAEVGGGSYAARVAQRDGAVL
jgi:hypothetical protein